MENKLMPYEDLQFIGNLIEKSRWIFAKTMPQNPHYYMLRKESDDSEFVRFVEIIRKYGYRNKYEGYWYTQLNVNNWFYWTMGARVDITILINRKERKLGIECPYDEISTVYEDVFTNDTSADEDVQVADFISRHNLTGKTLEIGCGSGMVTRNLFFNRGEYLGIDPSFKMIEEFKAHDSLTWLSTIHTDFESFYTKEKYNCIFATYGAASYVRPEFWYRLNEMLERGGSFVLMFYADDYVPVTHISTQIEIPYYSAKDFPQDISADIRSSRLGNYTILEGFKL